MRVGLAGAHNTGKTTLAEALAGTGSTLALVRVRTSAVFRSNNLNPARIEDFATRCQIQERVLESAAGQWRDAGQDFVSDRTPLDMAAYLLADLAGNTEHNAEAVQKYLRQCAGYLEGFFDYVVIVPPAIPVSARPGKAAPLPCYMEHLHAVICGLAVDGYANRRTFELGILPRYCVDLQDRVAAVKTGLKVLSYRRT